MTNADLTDFVIKPSPIHGFGLFATRDFKEGEVVLYFDNDANWFVNHSCVPTTILREVYQDNIRSDFLISKGIKAGEEITWDYKITRWHKFWKDLMERKCNCPKCKNEKFYQEPN